MTSVLIADDQALVRVGLRKILETDPETAVAGESPRAVDEDADADPLALRVDELLDAPVLRRHLLRAPDNGARVGVFGAGTGRGIDGKRTEIAHGFRTLIGASTAGIPHAATRRRCTSRPSRGAVAAAALGGAKSARLRLA